LVSWLFTKTPIRGGKSSPEILKKKILIVFSFKKKSKKVGMISPLDFTKEHLLEYLH